MDDRPPALLPAALILAACGEGPTPPVDDGDRTPPALATVSTAGVGTIVHVGEVTLQAEAAGVSGSVELTSVAADLSALTTGLVDTEAALGHGDDPSGPVRAF